jgi:hypothetical protein
MSSANQSTKYDSGYQSVKKEQRIDNLIQSQKRALDRFVVKKSQVSSNNQAHVEDPALDNSIHYCDNPIRDNFVPSPKPLHLVIKR